MAWWWWLLWLGCAPETPVHNETLEPLAVAVRAMEDAEALAAKEEWAAVVQAVDRALAVRPQDGVLYAWRSRAQRKLGQLDIAIADAQRGVREDPEDPAMHEELALALAAAGRLAEASQALALVPQLEGRTVRELAADPAWAAWVGHPSFPYLPSDGSRFELSSSDKTPFLGSEFKVSIRRQGDLQGPIELSGTLVGPVDWIGLEERWEEGQQTLTWTLKVRGAGDVRWQDVDMLGAEGPSQGIAGHTAAPSTAGDATEQSFPLQAPSAAIPDGELPMVWRTPAGVHLAHQAGERWSSPTGERPVRTQTWVQGDRRVAWVVFPSTVATLSRFEGVGQTGETLRAPR